MVKRFLTRGPLLASERNSDYHSEFVRILRVATLAPLVG